MWQSVKLLENSLINAHYSFRHICTKCFCGWESLFKLNIYHRRHYHLRLPRLNQFFVRRFWNNNFLGLLCVCTAVVMGHVLQWNCRLYTKIHSIYSHIFMHEFNVHTQSFSLVCLDVFHFKQFDRLKSSNSCMIAYYYFNSTFQTLLKQNKSKPNEKRNQIKRLICTSAFEMWLVIRIFRVIYAFERHLLASLAWLQAHIHSQPPNNRNSTDNYKWYAR